MSFSAYAIPAMFALLVKAGLFFYARASKVHNTETQLYLLFLFSLSIQNLAEIGLFSDLKHSLPLTTGGKLWYGAIMIAVALFLHLAWVISINRHEVTRRTSIKALTFIYAPTVVLEVFLWSGPLLIASFEPMSYSATKVPGPFFFLWELYAVSYLCVTLGLLVYGARTQTSAFRRSQCKLLVFSFIPFVTLGIGIIVLQRFGFRGFNAAATLPITTTFFLCFTAYVTHQHRLFDIAFFIPWSNVRKRKTAFYKRTQALIAEIADMPSVTTIVQRISDALRCPVVLIGGPRPALAMAGEALGVARFPLEELKKIDHILVANEIAEANPDRFALMKRHKVAAVVPFHPHSEAAASWMLLGDAFSEHVYTPLDFKVVESLFDRLADHFLDKQLLLRSQLSEAQREMQLLQERLATAWGQLEGARKRERELEKENHRLQRKGAQLLRHELSEVELELMDEALTGKKTLDEYGAEFEARMIEKVLHHCEGDRSRAAQILGLTPYRLQHKCLRFGLSGKIE